MPRSGSKSGRVRFTRRAASNDNTGGSRLVRIRIIDRPDPDQFYEYEVQHYRVGEIYELPVRFAMLLILAGCAEEVPRAVPVAEAADFGRPPLRLPASPKKS
jgi:hypothetical protein